MEGDHYDNLVEMPPIKDPTQEQLHHFIGEAAFFGWIADRGGMTQEEAIQERQRVLRRIGMGAIKSPHI